MPSLPFGKLHHFNSLSRPFTTKRLCLTLPTRHARGLEKFQRALGITGHKKKDQRRRDFCHTARLREIDDFLSFVPGKEVGRETKGRKQRESLLHRYTFLPFAVFCLL
jgi:hypothetical protein